MRLKHALAQRAVMAAAAATAPAASPLPAMKASLGARRALRLVRLHHLAKYPNYYDDPRQLAGLGFSLKKTLKKIVKAPVKLLKSTVKATKKVVKQAAKVVKKVAPLAAAAAAMYYGGPAAATALLKLRAARGGAAAEPVYDPGALIDVPPGTPPFAPPQQPSVGDMLSTAAQQYFQSRSGGGHAAPQPSYASQDDEPAPDWADEAAPPARTAGAGLGQYAMPLAVVAAAVPLLVIATNSSGSRRRR